MVPALDNISELHSRFYDVGCVNNIAEPRGIGIEADDFLPLPIEISAMGGYFFLPQSPWQGSVNAHRTPIQRF